MTPLESKIAALLVECANVIQPVRMMAQKWVFIKKNQKQLRSVEDKEGSAVFAYGRVRDKIALLPSYRLAKEAFERDSVFRDGLRTAGHWATFDAVLQFLIRSTAKSTKKKISLDHAKALQFFRSYRTRLTSSYLRYEAFARLFGLNLQRKAITLPDEVTLHRLNMWEKNKRQPIYFGPEWEEQVFGDYSVEMRVPVTVPVDHSEEGAFFKAQNAARQVASEIFSKVHEAILVAFSGRAQVSYVELKGGIEQMPLARSISREYMPPINIIIRPRDLPNISVAYDLVTGGTSSDKTLSRALHRFILGRRRVDPVDKLVDYVIAWEALLLTQEGNPITQELAYRFALNGALILSIAQKASDPRQIYKKMRSAYSTRSAIVHGGDDTVHDRNLHAGDFKDLQELCDFLESSFRSTVFWLAGLNRNTRPYRAEGGWESLLWPSQ